MVARLSLPSLSPASVRFPEVITLDYTRRRRRYHPPYWTGKRILALVVLLVFAGTCGAVVVWDAFASIVNAIYRATR